MFPFIITMDDKYNLHNADALNFYHFQKSFIVTCCVNMASFLNQPGLSKDV